jgi:sterol desaturase/sphingolipid hydroxylase (fatty acid hydroxylase superfamily)
MDDLYLQIGRFKSVVSAALLASLFLLENARPFFRGWTLNERVGHGARNLVLGLINATMSAVIFSVLWLAAARLSELQEVGLLYRSNAGVIGRAILAVLMLDFWTYFWHRWNHTIPFLWRFHRTHHSDPRMDVTTASRFHLGEIFFSGALRTPLVYLLGIQMHELVIYELLMYSVTQMHHANIGLSPGADRLLRWFIVSPGMHKIHHSRCQPETDSNYASLLSIWDRLFGSYRMRDDLASIRFGLDEFDARERQSLAGLVTTPFAEKRTALRRWLTLGWFIPPLLAAWFLARFAHFWTR